MKTYHSSGKRPDDFDLKLGEGKFQSSAHFADLAKLVEQCWQEDPTKRPPFTQILKRIESGGGSDSENSSDNSGSDSENGTSSKWSTGKSKSSH